MSYSFTPLQPSTLTDTSVPVIGQKVWKWESRNGGIAEQSAKHTIAVNVPSGDKAIYECSFIGCSHHEGKSWESLFIPLTPTGHIGMSLTWWRRKAGQAGQMQVKQVSETDWYGVVKSKAVDKGYTVNSYIGRSVPLNSKHSFVRDLHEDVKIPTLPQAALLKSQVERSAVVEIGGQLGNFCNLVPVHELLKKMKSVGHLVTTEVLKFLELDINSSSRNILGGFVERLEEVMCDTYFTSDEPNPSRESVVKAPPPSPIETYGNRWGAFG